MKLGYITQHQLNINGLNLPHSWPTFWQYLLLSFIFLIVSALFARIRLGSFPANPFYWHFWLILNAKKESSKRIFSLEKLYRIYLFFWAISIYFLALAVVTFCVNFSN
jgi:hypothetical protein